MKGVSRIGRPKGSTNKSIQDKKDLALQETKDWSNFAENSFVGSSINQTLNVKAQSKINKDELDRIMQNPMGNYQKLQDFSKYLTSSSGLYQRITKYLPYLPTYDLILICKSDSSKFLNKIDFEKAYEKNAMYLEKLKIKYNLPWFANELFVSGELFIYKVEDSIGIVYKKIPNRVCLPYSNINGVNTFVIDMSRMNIGGDNIETYPLEIQNAYAEYKKKSKDKLDIFIEEKWYPVSEKGVCFTFNKEGGHSIPPFANTFKDIANIDENKAMQKQKNTLDNTKMIHNKIPLDKDSKPILPPNVAEKYNQAIADNLTDGMFSITNPFEPEVLQLTDKSQKVTTLTQEAVAQFFDNMGVSDMLFNNSKASSEALKKSVITDAIWVINEVITMFNAYLDKELSDNTAGAIKFMVKMLDMTHYDKVEVSKQAGAELSYGGSKQMFLASKGLTPLQGLNLLRGEALMELNELFNPVASSHTTSGDVSKSRTDNPSESTEISRDNGSR